MTTAPNAIPVSWPRLLPAALPGLVLSIVGATACTMAGGKTLGTFIGGLGVAAMLAPALVLAEGSAWRRLFAAGAIIDGIGLVWLWVCITSPIAFWQWLQCYVVLAAFVAAVASVAVFLRRCHVPAAAGAAVGLFLSLAWLSWPIWLAPWMHGTRAEPLANALVVANPVFAINSVLLALSGPWPEQAWMYWHTNLGRDINYAMPASIWPAVLVHAAIAVALIGAAAKLGLPLLRHRHYAQR